MLNFYCRYDTLISSKRINPAEVKMVYDSGTGEYKNWIVKEECVPEEHPEKTESIMCLGNGYMGQRAANEDYYHEKSRFNLIAGTFDVMGGDEATELPNNADVTNCEITVDEERLTPEGGCEGYEKTLINLVA